MEKIRILWTIAYKVWPPIIRGAEKFGLHDFRQKYLLGHLNAKYNSENLENLLFRHGFENALIAWCDPGEVLSMRLIHKEIYQYHIRLFKDGEIRAHYEFTPESHPYDHFMEAHFNPETEYYKKLLGEFLVSVQEIKSEKEN